MQDLTLRREYFEKHSAWIGKYFSSGNIFSSGATAKRISVSLWIYKQEIMEQGKRAVFCLSTKLPTSLPKCSLIAILQKRFKNLAECSDKRQRNDFTDRKFHFATKPTGSLKFLAYLLKESFTRDACALFSNYQKYFL